ncbi:uncharacterized protein [Triticum aestivum]|nr:uncharacterized protein LOC123148082 isoform X2 [Triticum aestivum]
MNRSSYNYRMRRNQHTAVSPVRQQGEPRCWHDHAAGGPSFDDGGACRLARTGPMRGGAQAAAAPAGPGGSRGEAAPPLGSPANRQGQPGRTMPPTSAYIAIVPATLQQQLELMEESLGEVALGASLTYNISDLQMHKTPCKRLVRRQPYHRSTSFRRNHYRLCLGLHSFAWLTGMGMALAPRSSLSLRSLLLLMSHRKPHRSSFFSSSAAVPPAAPGTATPAADPAVQPPAAPDPDLAVPKGPRESTRDGPPRQPPGTMDIDAKDPGKKTL